VRSAARAVAALADGFAVDRGVPCQPRRDRGRSIAGRDLELRSRSSL